MNTPYSDLFVQQLSEEMERKAYNEQLKRIETDPLLVSVPYGVILHTCIVRDLSGIGLSHLGSEGQEIIKSVMGMQIHKITRSVLNNIFWYRCCK